MGKPVLFTCLRVRALYGEANERDLEEPMKATVLHGAGDVRVEHMPDASIEELLPDILDRAMNERESLKVMVRP